MGYVDIVGANDAYSGAEDDLDALLAEAAAGDEYFGAVARPSGRGAGLARALAAARKSQLVERQPSRGRTLTLGFVSANIASLASETVTRRPQVPFKPERFVTASATAGSFEITDIKVGKDSMFVSANNVPAQAYSELAQGVAMEFDTAQVSQDISVAVTNISLAAAVFRASMIGKTIY